MTRQEIVQTIQALRACASGEAEDCPFTAVAGCGNSSHWEWRGLKEEPKEGGKA